MPAPHDLNNDSRFLLSRLARTLLFGAMVPLPALLRYCDIHWLQDDVGQWSLVELTQAEFLLASTLAFIRLACRRVEERRFAVLAAGLLACMLLRERDAVRDVLVHGLWQWLALPLAMACGYYAAQQWRAVVSAMVRFLSSRAGTLMTIGLVLLFYARLIGLTALGDGLLGESHLRVFKNAIEQTTELLGYIFILAASLAHVAQGVPVPARGARPVAAAPGRAVQRL